MSARRITADADNPSDFASRWICLIIGSSNRTVTTLRDFAAFLIAPPFIGPVQCMDYMLILFNIIVNTAQYDCVCSALYCLVLHMHARLGQQEKGCTRVYGYE